MKTLYTLLAVSLLTVCKTNAQNDLLNFDGIDDYVDLGPAAVTDVRTIELWFTPNVAINQSLADYSTLVARNDAAQNDEINIVFLPNSFGSDAGKIAFHRNVGGVLQYIVSDNNSWSAGVCYHVAAVIDPVSGMKMYINGVLQADTHSYTGAPDVASDITTIGRYGDGAIRYFNGKIDEVRFWNVARTASEIQTHYQLSVYANAPGLVGLWSFDEGSGTTAADGTLYSNDGTIYGATWNTGSCLVSINETAAEKVDLTVFPNPIEAGSILKIGNPQGKSYSLFIYDLTGRTIFSAAGLREEEISLKNLLNEKPGIYHLQVFFDDFTAGSSIELVITE